MCVYLIHFSVPYKHARHYLGYSSDVRARIACHEHGNGARLMEVVTQAGIPWVVSKVWMDGDQALERRLHNRHGSMHLCPICRGDVPIGYSVDVRKKPFDDLRQPWPVTRASGGR